MTIDEEEETPQRPKKRNFSPTIEKNLVAEINFPL